MHPHAQNPERHFWTYVLPAMGGQLLTGFFIIVDGFFIGQKLGDSGLAAINLLWPIPAVVLAVGLGLGSGGSVLLAGALGAGDAARAARARGNTITALAMATALLMSLLWLCHRPLLGWLGAEGPLLDLALPYCRIIILLAGAQVFNSGLAPLLRASGRTVAAMAILVLGLLTNIFLDWLFIMVFSWGMAGAAWATVAAQALGGGLELLLLCTDRALPMRFAQLRPAGATLRKLIFVGVSPFGLSLSANILVVFFNWQCLAWGGAPAVATYAIMSYLLGSLQPLLSGVGEGAQPLVSMCCGAGNTAGQRRLLGRCVRLVLVLALALCAGAIALRGAIPALFGASPDTAAGARAAVVCAAVSLPFWGLVRVFASYFYATRQAGKSNLLIFGDPLLASPLCLWTLPLLWGLTGVWLSAVAAQVLLCLVLAALLWRGRRTPG